MRGKTMLVSVIGVVIGVLLSTAVVLAGSLNPIVGPTGADSQMYTLQQIYDRLATGAATPKMTGFTEPSSGPTGGTMSTLDDIMAKAPALDATNGATADQVLSGKTFWGLTAGAWGPQTGTFSLVGTRATARLWPAPDISRSLDGQNSNGTSSDDPDTESVDVTQILGVAASDTLPEILGVPSNYLYREAFTSSTVYEASVAYPASISAILGTPTYDPFTGLPLTAVSSYPSTWVESSNGAYRFTQSAPIALRVRSVMSELAAYRQAYPNP
jgi:hypothetical protein